MATILIPSPLRKFTDNLNKIPVDRGDVSGAILELITSYPKLKKHLMDSNGHITTFINIFVNNYDIRNLDREQTVVTENSVISIIPAIAGGIDIS